MAKKETTVYDRIKKELGIDVSDKRRFTVQELPNGYVLTAKTSEATDAITKAHLATVGKGK